MRFLVEDARYMIGEATTNLSVINFNVMSPNTDMQGGFSFNFQELF